MSAQIEDDCDALIRGLDGDVVAFSVRGTAPLQHVGLPDRRYRVRGVGFWAELKSGRDKLSMAQWRFLEAEHKVGSIVFAGDAPALKAMVYGSVPSKWYEIGWANVTVILARGFRKER
jgi:hypothetical protein